jgi:thioredoxin 1
MNKISMQELKEKGLIIKDGEVRYERDKYLILDFYADWCKPCKMQESVLDDMMKNYNDVEFYKVNVEDEYELGELLLIKSLPTIIICSNKNIKKIVGFSNKTKLEEMIKDQTIKIC